MINLLIRILSLIICVGLLVGGAILSYNATMENDEFRSDLDDISEAQWIAGIEDAAGQEQIPDDGGQLTE